MNALVHKYFTLLTKKLTWTQGTSNIIFEIMVDLKVGGLQDVIDSHNSCWNGNKITQNTWNIYFRLPYGWPQLTSKFWGVILEASHGLQYLQKNWK